MSMLDLYLSSDDVAYAQALKQAAADSSEWLATRSIEYRDRIAALKAADYDLDLLVKIDEYQEDSIKNVIHNATLAAYARYEELIAEGLDEDEAIEQADAEADAADNHADFEATMDDASEVLEAYLEVLEAAQAQQKALDLAAEDDAVSVEAWSAMADAQEAAYDAGIAQIMAMLS